MMHLTSTSSWKTLQQHADARKFRLLNDFNPGVHTQDFMTKTCGIQLDYSYQRITTETLSFLFDLAKERELCTKIKGLFQGEKVNISENRPALHSALRAPAGTPIFVDGQDVMPEILKARQTIQHVAEKIRSKQWLGFSGEPIKDIVNIGIGGSDLGPRFCVNALREYISPSLGLHFISDADPSNFQYALGHLKPETTLFIISSKSFSTQETLYNAKKAIEWLGDKQYVANHVIAVTANQEKAAQYGIKTIIPVWEWVGGRYSLCSAINLITAIGIGFEMFSELLAGAHEMDNHFQYSNISTNLPILLALLGIWNNNFLHINNLLFWVYSKNLELFVPYLQQLDMESNGKSVDIYGRTVNYKTGPIVWGGLGNQAQHSYYQLLSQGTHKVTADFISLKPNNGQLINELCNLKINLLAKGETGFDSASDFTPGNITMNHLHLDSCSPYTIGALVALYEHKIFAQGVIWGINPFDQPGVAKTKRKVNHATAI
ncbi:glucose-6-phosphate isomerase [Legionella feeleii]